MSKLLASRTSVVIAATLFALATWVNVSSETTIVPTNLTVVPPAPQVSTLAQAR